MSAITLITAAAAAAAAKSLQSCPTLCDPIDGSPPGSPVHGIFQARVLEWVSIAFSNYTHYCHPITDKWVTQSGPSRQQTTISRVRRFSRQQFRLRVRRLEVGTVSC